MSDLGPRPSFFGWRDGLWLLSAAHFTAHADRILPAIVAPTLKARFQLTDGELGLLLGPAFVLAFVTGSVLTGRFVDRLPRFRLIAWGVLIWSIATVAFGMAGGLEHFVAARVGLGLGQALLAPAALSLIMQQAPPMNAGRAIAAFTSGATLGRSSALLIGGVLLAALSSASGIAAATGAAPWRLLFVLAALPNLVLAALLIARREPASFRSRSAPAGLASWVRRTPAIGLHLAISGSALLLTQSVAVWGPSLFARSTGLDPARSAIWTGVAVLIAAPLGHGIGGRAVDWARRAERAPTAVLAAFLLAVVPCAIGLARAEGAAPLLGAFFLLTAAVGAAAVAALASYQPLIPARMRGEGNALYFAVISLVGLGLGPPLVGLVSDRLGATPDGLLLALGGTVAAVALPAALASLSSSAMWTRAAAEAAAEASRS